MRVIEVAQEENGWTHIKWQIDNVTTNMLDWHWSNMEKDFILWHPEDHTEVLEWPVPVTKDRFVGAIHFAPQKRKGGEVELMRLRYYDLAEVDKKYRDLVVHKHAVMVGRCGTGRSGENDHPPVSHRLHQYSPTEYGVEGISTACNPVPKPDIELEKRLNRGWADHCIDEFGNFEKFLPDLYNMWQVVKNPDINLFHSLKVDRSGGDVRYVNLK